MARVEPFEWDEIFVEELADGRGVFAVAGTDDAQTDGVGFDEELAAER